MKKNYLFIFVLFLCYSFGIGQTLGDFRSNNASPSVWTSSSSWETWDGVSNWIAATEYPGQNTGTYTVTIATGTTITIPTNLSTTAMGSLIVNGPLILGDGTSNQHISTLSTKLLTINPTGTLTFSGPKVRLILPTSDAVLIIEPSGTINGNCTNNDEIFIDTSKYATCVGPSSTTYSFGEIVAAGGTINAKITNPATNPITVSGCIPINLEGGYTGTEINVSYVWKVRFPDGSTTTTNPVILEDNTKTASTSFTPDLPGEYLVSLEITTTSLATNVETRTFNVVDTTNPTISCPANVSVNNTPGTCGATVIYTTPVGADNCSGATTTQTAGLASGSIFPLGTTTNTFEVTDAAGLKTSCSFTVTVVDNQAPAISCPDNVSVNNTPGTCGATVTYTTPVGADNCSGATTTQTAGLASGANFPLGTTTNTFEVTDAAGLKTSCSFNVTVVDNQAPAISCPDNVSVNNTPGTCGATVTYTTPVGADNCSGATTTQTAGLASGSIFPLGTTTNTFEVTDAAGLKTSCSFTLTVVDNQAPTLTVIADRNENLGAACSFVIPDYTGLTSAADNCTATGSIIKTQLPVSGTLISGHNTTQLITITANDGNGNTESTSFIITLKDVTAPATPTLTAVNVGQCSGTPTAPTTTDNCAGTVTGTTATIFPITTQGVTVVTWTFSDGNGNSTSANQSVTVDDTTKPTLTAIADRNENLGAACSFVIPDYTGLTSAADNCTATGSIIKTQLPVSGTLISEHNTTQLITITANDGNGNTESTSFTITLKDVTAPATPTLADVNVGQCSGTPTAPTTTDTCAGTVTGTPNLSFPITTQGVTVVTWTFSDGNGNSTTANQSVTVDDTTKPTLTAIAARNENLGAACSFVIPDYTGLTTATDNCTATGSIIKTQLPVAGTLISGHNTTQLITITANDGNGNTESTSFTITLKDVTAPATPTLTAVNVGQCNGTPTAPTTTDNCAGTITGTPNLSFPITTQGVTVVTWTFSDGNGNSTTANQSVTVDDTTKPTLTAIANRNENLGASCSFAILDYTGLTNAADNCTPTGSIIKTQLPVSGTLISGHNTTQLITITANDGNGNTESTTFTITLKDVTAPATPTLTAVNVGQCSGTPTAPTTTDNCAGIVTGTTATIFPITTQGTTVVTWTFSDGNGNSTTANQSVTVDDTTKPTLTSIAARNENLGAACSFTIPDYTGLTNAADNCTPTGSIIKTQLPVAGTLISGHNTTQLITITANDGNGNTESTSFTITLKDVTAPATPTLTAVNVGQCSGTPTAPTTTDNCAGIVTGTTATIFPITTQGTTVVTWTFSDGNGNSTTANQNVTVLDNIVPTITAQANIATTTNTACTATGLALGTPTTGDNCSVASVTNNAPAAFPLGNTTVTWTVTDSSGNTATATQLVTVTDNAKPTISCSANISQNIGAGSCTASVIIPNPTIADNCSVTKLTWVLTGATAASSAATGINNIGTRVFNLGVTTITYIVTDAANNTATCSYTVTITDNINPTITCPLNMSANTSASCTASVVTPNPTFADNCSVTKLTWALTGATALSSAATGINYMGTQTFNRGITTATYRVEDAAGNFTTCSFTVTVVDNIAPTVSLSNVTAQCSITLTAPTASDNCAGTVTGTTNDPTTYNSQGTFVVTWAFNDGNGNVTTRTQNVIIDDTIAPVANVASLPTLNITGCQIDTLTLPTATDACKGIINGATSTPLPITTQGTTVVTWTYNDGNGNTTSQTQNIVLTAPPISGGTLVGSIDNIIPAMTPTDNIAITSCPDEVNPITMNLSSETGTIVRWEKFEAGDSAWSVIANTTNSYNIIFNYTNTKSTLFRVLVQVGTCTKYSNIVNVHAIPPDVPPILDQNLFNICLNTPVTLVARSGYISTVEVGDGGDFNEGQFPDKWDPTQWKIDNIVAGTAWTAAANNTKVNNWTGTNDDKNVGSLYIIKYDNGTQNKKFGMAHGNYNSADYISKFGVGPTTLETPIFSLVGLETASVDFDQAFNLHAGDYAKLELSLDGGASYTVTLQDLIGTNPPLKWDWQNHPPSTASSFMFANDNSSFDISQYIGNDNVRVKWTFFGTTDESAWAIDNITIPVRPYSDEVEWTDGLGNPGEYIIRNQLEAAYTFTPSAPGVHQYGATSLINGCRAYDPDGTALATVNVNYAYAGEAIAYTNAECGERTVQLNAYDNTKSANDNKLNGAYPLALNTFSDDPGTQETGKWSVFSTTNTCGTYSFSNISSPTSTFSGDAGVYTLRWTLDTSGCYSDVQVTLTNCNVVDFDGTDDYVNFKNNYVLGNDFSIEVWVKPDPQPANPLSNIQTIFSKRNANNLIDGYDLRLTGGALSFNWNNGSQIVSPFPLTTSRWYHVAVTRNSGIYRLYVDGIEVVNAAGSAPITNTSDCIAGAMDQTGNSPNRPVNHFSGWLDELRIWNTGLGPEHIRQMMNQQIVNNGTAVRGEIVPIDINGPDVNKDGADDQPLSWTNLIGYYRMNQIECGYLKPFSGKGVDAKLRNITSSQEETAPLPYTSIRDGNWMDRNAGTTPWKYGDSVWDYPNSTGYNGTPIDWNIVQTAHNVNSGNKDITVLGLISTVGKLTIADPIATSPIENNDGQALWITHYLKLNGSIDLIGESQLLQKRYTTNQFIESTLDVASTGYIERDQQGKRNSFNYNYWSSPVSNIQGISNNTTYSPAGVLKDGTLSSTPKTITFGDGAYFADGALSNPILTSNRWIWSYNSQTLETNSEWQDYFQWNYVGNSGLLKTGEGFTMKGTGGTASIDTTQNYVFVGKPNNGNIALPLPYDQTYLVGNPYPSALDADEFILDNLAGRAGVNVFNGALYFWDHFGLSNNHNLAEYEGGYATYTLIGGVKAIATSSLTAGGMGSKVPQRYIPVGQGFFVDAYLDPSLSGTTATVSGGTLNFKNSQRAFMRESTSNSVFMKKRESTKTNGQNKPKIRLGFDSPIGAHRQLLVGVDTNTTNNYDLGYDAPMFDTNENDVYWKINESQFVIQGVPDFNTSRIIPLGLVIANEGELSLKIDELENFPSGKAVYLHDTETGMYHDLKNNSFKTVLAAGNYDTRFSLTFESKTTETFLEVTESNSNDGIIVLFSNNYNMLIIRNNELDSTVNKVSLFNILGQHITNWDVEDKEQTNIQIPIKNIPSGIYIVKVKTSKGESSKKIVIN